MNATDGSGAGRFSPDAAVERSPHWSPDGERIAFVATRPNDNAVVWRDVKKQNRTAVTTHEVAASANSFGKPTWSRDGQKLAFTSLVPGGQTYVAMDAFDGSAAVLFQGAMKGYVNLSPAWSR